jgi:hypothetical protein
MSETSITMFDTVGHISGSYDSAKEGVSAE